MSEIEAAISFRPHSRAAPLFIARGTVFGASQGARATMPEGGNHEGAVNSVLAKVDTEAGREVVRAIPPEHVRSAKALVDEALDIVGPNAVVRPLTFQSHRKTRVNPISLSPNP